MILKVYIEPIANGVPVGCGPGANVLPLYNIGVRSFFAIMARRTGLAHLLDTWNFADVPTRAFERQAHSLERAVILPRTYFAGSLPRPSLKGPLWTERIVNWTQMRIRRRTKRTNGTFATSQKRKLMPSNLGENETKSLLDEQRFVTYIHLNNILLEGLHVKM